MPQVLTNENGGIAMISSLGPPMDVKSFYISNPSKVVHVAAQTVPKALLPPSCVG